MGVAVQIARDGGHTKGGPAHWDATQGMITLDGAPTIVAGTNK